MKQIKVIDTTLRDGMHSVAHQYTVEQMAEIAGALDRAGVYAVEVSHGDGLGGSSIQYGFSLHTDEEYLNAVSKVLTRAKLAVLLLPGIGTQEDLEMAKKAGASVARVATHVTEADIAEQHIGLTKELGMESINFLMMAHMAPIEVMLEKTPRQMESYGSDAIYVVDSAGYMLPGEVADRVKAMKDALKCRVGFHAHNNLGLASANVLAAVENGADFIDGSLCAMGAGGGNASTEIVAAVLDRYGMSSGLDLYRSIDAAQNHQSFKRKNKGRHLLKTDPRIRGCIFQLHAPRRAGGQTVQSGSEDILVELGRKKGGRRPGGYDHRCGLRDEPKSWLRPV